MSKRYTVRPDTWFCATDLAETTKTSLIEFGGLPAAPADVIAKLAPITEPLEYRAAAVRERVPACEDHVTIVRRTIEAEGGAPYLEDHAHLPEALLHGVYESLGDTQADEDRVAEEAQRLWPAVRELAYEDKIRRMALRKKGITTNRTREKAIRERMEANRVAYGSPAFEHEVLRDVADIAPYASLFTSGPRTKAVTDDLDEPLSRPLLQASAQVLRDSAVKPDAADKDWGRIAVAVASTRPGGEGLRLSRQELPDLDSAAALGISPERIRIAADLYAVHVYDELGVLEAVDELADRAADQVQPVDCDLAVQLYMYLKQRPHRLPAEYLKRITSRLFESGPEGRSFETLMGALGDALAELNELRTAYVTHAFNGNRQTALDSVLPLVDRTVTELALHLSQAVGPVGGFVARDAFGQLVEALEILRSDDLVASFGGDGLGGPLSIVEELVGPRGAGSPPAEQVPTLARTGREIIGTLADWVEDPSAERDFGAVAGRLSVWRAAARAGGDRASGRPAIERTGRDGGRSAALRGSLSW